MLLKRYTNNNVLVADAKREARVYALRFLRKGSLSELGKQHRPIARCAIDAKKSSHFYFNRLSFKSFIVLKLVCCCSVRDIGRGYIFTSTIIGTIMLNNNWFSTFYPFAAFSIVLHTVFCQDFGYDGSVGPTHWGETYRQCVGKHQSPINIEDHNLETIWLYPMRFEHFDQQPEYAEMKNNGHTVVLTMKTKHPNKIPRISGGPLIGKYEFAQLHFHWGSHDSEGSENTINNSSFPMELHMVFYQQAYKSFDNAVEHPDGLVVLSFLFSNSATINKNYDSITEVLPDLEFVNSVRPLKTMPTFDALTIKNRSVYYTYGGSLTTPPCSEVVTWIEFKNTVPLAHSQIEAFRHLKDEHGNLMSHNFRPTQPLYGRLIRMVYDDSKHFYLVHNELLKANESSGNINRPNLPYAVIVILLGLMLLSPRV